MQEYMKIIDKKDLPASINSQKLIRDLSYPDQYLRPLFKEEIYNFLKSGAQAYMKLILCHLIIPMYLRNFENKRE